MNTLLITCAALIVVMLCGYLAACAGSERFINFWDWLLLKPTKPRATADAIAEAMQEEREAEAFVDAQWKAADDWLAAEWPWATEGERAVARPVWTELARRHQDAAGVRAIDGGPSNG